MSVSATKVCSSGSCSTTCSLRLRFELEENSAPRRADCRKQPDASPDRLRRPHRKNGGSGLRKLESQDPFTRNIFIIDFRWIKFPTSSSFQGQLGKISA